MLLVHYKHRSLSTVRCFGFHCLIGPAFYIFLTSFVFEKSAYISAQSVTVYTLPAEHSLLIASSPYNMTLAMISLSQSLYFQRNANKLCHCLCLHLLH